MEQILRATHYMHQSNVCHRDLRPENFFFADQEVIEKSTLKLIDFGFSCMFTADTVLTTKLGTPYYVAPEILHGKYDERSDIWSCGVIMFVLFCGCPPFYDDTDA